MDVKNDILQCISSPLSLKFKSLLLGKYLLNLKIIMYKFLVKYIYSLRIYNLSHVAIGKSKVNIV